MYGSYFSTNLLNILGIKFKIINKKNLNKRQKTIYTRFV